jgi:hypothetical protein
MKNNRPETAECATLHGHAERRSDAKKSTYRGISTNGLHSDRRSSERWPPGQVFPTRIVILGGGFAGVATAEHLERKFGAASSVDLTLVSDSNTLLYTPMLAQVAASSVEPTHISSPKDQPAPHQHRTWARDGP